MIVWTVCSVTSGNRRQTVTMRSDGRQTDCCDLRDQCIISCCRHRRRRTRSYDKSALPCTSSVHICETAWSDTAVQVCSPWQTDTQLSVSNRHRSAVIGQLCLLSWPQDVSHRPVPYRAGPFISRTNSFWFNKENTRIPISVVPYRPLAVTSEAYGK